MIGESVPVIWKSVSKREHMEHTKGRAGVSLDRLYTVSGELVEGEKGSNHQELIHHLKVFHQERDMIN